MRLSVHVWAVDSCRGYPDTPRRMQQGLSIEGASKPGFPDRGPTEQTGGSNAVSGQGNGIGTAHAPPQHLSAGQMTPSLQPETVP